MKRARQFSNEASRVGHILFWLFPDEAEWDRNGSLGTSEGCAMRAQARKDQWTHMLERRRRTRPVPKAAQGWMLIVTGLLFLGGLVSLSCI
jgi:hypothetical protein